MLHTEGEWAGYIAVLLAPALQLVLRYGNIQID